jgi:hypothetical protein
MTDSDSAAPTQRAIAPRTGEPAAENGNADVANASPNAHQSITIKNNWQQSVTEIIEGILQGLG